MTTAVVGQDEQPESARAILPVASGRRTAVAFGQLLRRYPGRSVLSVLTAVAATVAAVLVPLLLGRVVDLVLAGGSLGGLLVLAGGLLAAGLVAGVLTALARGLVSALGATVCADLREDVLDHALRLDADRLEAAGSGDVASRVTEDVELVTGSAQLAAGVFAALVTVVVTFAGFATLDPRIAVAFLAVAPVYALALRSYIPKASRLFAAERRTAAERTDVVLATLNGVATVHAYGLAERQGRRVERASQGAAKAGLAAIRGFLNFANAMNMAEAVGLTAVLLTGFLLVRGGGTSVGDVTAAALLFHRLFGPLGLLLFSVSDVQSAGAALARLVGIADLDVSPVGPAGHPRTSRTALGLSAHHVRHAYPAGPEVLHGITLDVSAGGSLAVVGESGAGKTTLAAILGGVFPAGSGAVRIGDRSIAELDPVALRRLVGVVTQEIHVFAGTLAADLRLAVPDATDDELWAALTLVGAREWVEALPHGLDTTVGQGGHPLSAARAQQLALARVAVVDPPIVVLDEATAEAGSAGARQLEQASAALLDGRTAVVVAHRLTQAQACDRIAVLADGRVVELGSPAELVAAGGTYAELWAAWHR